MSKHSLKKYRKTPPTNKQTISTAHAWTHMVGTSSWDNCLGNDGTVNHREAAFEGTFKGGPLIYSHILLVLQQKIKGSDARATCATPFVAPFKIMWNKLRMLVPAQSVRDSRLHINPTSCVFSTHPVHVSIAFVEIKGPPILFYGPLDKIKGPLDKIKGPCD